MNERMKSERRLANAEARAELSFTQALWYAWGRLDAVRSFASLKLDAFEFAAIVRKATREFELEETYTLDSIQGAWDKYVASKSV